eukprot:Hpha_TRINITY_DN30263_c0_g1::TRINITY_DN30263_c0_g1_i1::g.27187::m.27187
MAVTVAEVLRTADELERHGLSDPACALLLGAAQQGLRRGFAYQDGLALCRMAAQCALRNGKPGAAVAALQSLDGFPARDLTGRALLLEAEAAQCGRAAKRFRLASEGLAEAQAALGSLAEAVRGSELQEKEVDAAVNAHWFRFHLCLAGLERVVALRREGAEAGMTEVIECVRAAVKEGGQAAKQQVSACRSRKRKGDDEESDGGESDSYGGGEERGGGGLRRRLKRSAKAGSEVYSVLSAALDRLRSTADPAGPAAPPAHVREGPCLAREVDGVWYPAVLVDCKKDDRTVRFTGGTERVVSSSEVRPARCSVVADIGGVDGTGPADRALGALAAASRMARGVFRTRVAAFAEEEGRLALTATATSPADVCALCFAAPALFTIAGASAAATGASAKAGSCFGRALAAIQSPNITALTRVGDAAGEVRAKRAAGAALPLFHLAVGGALCAPSGEMSAVTRAASTKHIAAAGAPEWPVTVRTVAACMRALVSACLPQDSNPSGESGWVASAHDRVAAAWEEADRNVDASCPADLKAFVRHCAKVVSPFCTSAAPWLNPADDAIDDLRSRVREGALALHTLAWSAARSSSDTAAADAAAVLSEAKQAGEIVLARQIAAEVPEAADASHDAAIWGEGRSQLQSGAWVMWCPGDGGYDSFVARLRQDTS